jgi:PAS domain S-box-containing protein
MDGRYRYDLNTVIGNIGDFTDDAILITEAEPIDRPGPKIVWANKAFCRMTGYALDEILGQSPRILQGEDTDPVALARIRDALQSWKPVRVEVKNYRKDGSPFWVDLGIQPVTDDQGWHHYWVAIQRETTERHERDQLLRRTTQIIDSAPIALGLLSADNRLTFANDHFSRLIYGVGLSPALPLPYDGWLRRGLADQPTGESAAEWVRRHFAGLFSTPARIEQRLYGRWHEFRRVSTAAGDQLIIGEDIEERMQLQEQLRHMTKLDAMGQLTSGVAHDFNNLLAVILGNVELLQNDLEPDDDRDAMITETVNAVLKGRSLTQSLLSFARKSHIDPRPSDLAILTRETVAMFRRTSATGIEIVFEEAADLPSVFVDPNLFQNALLNLLLNARDAMNAGGRITVSAEVADAMPDGAGAKQRCVRVTVADEGVGMEPNVLRQAIEPFFTTKETGNGSGLGLSMVHGFVRQSGGSLDVSSTPGAGTCVTLEFPADTRPVGPAVDPNEPPADLSGLHILLVEDEVAIRRLLTRMIEKAGAAVTAVPNGDAARELQERWARFDLLISDIVMPGVTQGDMLARHFSDACPGTPVILLSGNPEIMNTVQPGHSTAATVLSKPVHRTALLKAIADCVRTG